MHFRTIYFSKTFVLTMKELSLRGYALYGFYTEPSLCCRCLKCAHNIKLSYAAAPYNPTKIALTSNLSDAVNSSRLEKLIERMLAKNA